MCRQASVHGNGGHRPDGSDLIGAWTRSPVTDLSLRPAVRPVGQITPNGGANHSMTTEATNVVGGVDTDYGAAVDQQGRLLSFQELRATDCGSPTLRPGCAATVRSG